MRARIVAGMGREEPSTKRARAMATWDVRCTYVQDLLACRSASSVCSVTRRPMAFSCESARMVQTRRVASRVLQIIPCHTPAAALWSRIKPRITGRREIHLRVRVPTYRLPLPRPQNYILFFLMLSFSPSHRSRAQFPFATIALVLYFFSFVCSQCLSLAAA